MLYHISSTLISILLGLSMILLFLAGHYLKSGRVRKNPGLAEDNFGPIEGSLLGLLALLLSFTFGMSNNRYDTRYQAMIHEANCIGTVLLRADLLPDSTQGIFRKYGKGYLSSRIELYDAGFDPEKNETANHKSALYGDSLWQLAATLVRSEDIVKRNSGSLLVGSLNDLFDAATSRRASREATLPDSILWLLFILCLASAFIVGYGGKQKVNWVMVIGFSVMVSITVFAILDLDRPHRGLITLDKAEERIVELAAH